MYTYSVYNPPTRKHGSISSIVSDVKQMAEDDSDG